MHLADILSKATYIAFKLQFYILSALAFPGKANHEAECVIQQTLLESIHA